MAKQTVNLGTRSNCGDGDPYAQRLIKSTTTLMNFMLET